MDFTQNYFQLLQLPQQYPVDVKQLSERYRELQKEFHPDKFSSQSSSEQRLSVQFASYINTAYQTLKSPVLRAEYLLSLSGQHVDHQSTTISDHGFLLLQMEWREALSAITVSVNDTNSEENAEQELDALHKEVNEYLLKTQCQFEQEYNKQCWDEAKQAIAQLHFIEKMLREIITRESTLFDE